MSDVIQFEHVSFRYPDAARPALCDVSFSLAEGSLLLVAGVSGAGKSTLLRCINGLVPHFSGGSLAGRITVDGLDPVQATPQQMSQRVGFVFQDPETQFVMDTVEDEIAFGLENAAVAPQEMRVRVEETLDLLDLARLRRRALAALSGGERQRVAIAAALALRPHILVLDEPTSQLDPQSAEEVLAAAARLNEELGLTVVLAEHRLERVLGVADRLLFLPGDGPPLSGEPRAVLAQADLGPPVVRLGKALGWAPLPLTVKEGLRFSRSLPQPARPAIQPVNPPDSSYIQARGIETTYGGEPVLRGVNLDARRSEIAVLMGRNGSGKSTLLKTLVGLARPRRGQVTVAGRNTAGMEVAEICRHVGYLPQDPNSLLFADSVGAELETTLRNFGLPTRDAAGRLPDAALRLLDDLDLTNKIDAYPRDLSVGERQRVALAAILAAEPQGLLLDEPTRGLDYGAKRRLADLLDRWRSRGMAIVVVTHDVEWAAELADRVLVMSQGEIIADGAPGEILAGSPLFAPQVARLFPNSGWLTVDDVLAT
jgi:energy-coupling factor transport system ATP-binding protein